MRFLGGICFFFFTLFCSCTDHSTVFGGHAFDALASHFKKLDRIDFDTIQIYLDSLARHDKKTAFANKYTKRHYTQGGQWLWLTRENAELQADTLLTWLNDSRRYGLEWLMQSDVRQLEKQIRLLRTLRLDSIDNVNLLLAQTEFLLTKAYLRYATMQRFGVTNPALIYNRFQPVQGDTTGNRFVRLFDLTAERPDSTFAATALDALNSSLGSFLSTCLPSSEIHMALVRAYNAPATTATQKRTLRVNLERCRWRMAQMNDTASKYILINLPSQMLEAVSSDTAITMKICYGSVQHKTPLLTAQIHAAQINPVWTVPQSIINNEIVPRHTGDAAYFARNRMQILHRKTGKAYSPTQLTAADLRSGAYKIVQQSGEGNSLGRIIFRFNNNFSIFLHDTSNKGGFSLAQRAISHGCIRVEQPLQLACFLLPEPNEKLEERIRFAVHPEDSITYRHANLPYPAPIRYLPYSPTIPLRIIYFTAYPDRFSADAIAYYPDIYGFDAPLLRALADK